MDKVDQATYTLVAWAALYFEARLLKSKSPPQVSVLSFNLDVLTLLVQGPWLQTYLFTAR